MTGPAIRPARGAPTASPPGIEWRVSDDPVEYRSAVSFMERRIEAIRTGARPETVWLLEHPPLYTAGTSARDDELLEADRFPVYRTGRGGRYTYHGPGQRVVYPMLDLRRRGQDVRAYVRALEAWIVATLARFGVEAAGRDDRIGIWVRRPDGSEAKIAAVGVRIRRWITYHGVAVNVAPDLSHFDGIVACGLPDYAVTSLRDLGRTTTMAEVDAALRETFPTVFATASRERPSSTQT